MGQGISEILTFSVGVAISPVPIIAVTLMLFSQRARMNGPAFLAGWVAALAVVSGVVYVLADQASATSMPRSSASGERAGTRWYERGTRTEIDRAVADHLGAREQWQEQHDSRDVDVVLERGLPARRH